MNLDEAEKIIKEVIEYFSNNKIVENEEDKIILKKNLDENPLLTVSIYYYIDIKESLEDANKLSEDIRHLKILHSYFPFSQLLLLIDLISKTKYGKSSRNNFINLIKCSLSFNKETVKICLNNSNIDIIPINNKPVNEEFIEEIGKKYNGKNFKDLTTGHIYCYEWTHNDIKKIEYIEEKNGIKKTKQTKCYSSFDLIKLLEKGKTSPKYKQCINNYKENSLDSLASFLYELRCNYVHNAIPAVINAYDNAYDNVLIKNDKKYFYKLLDINFLESNIFSILVREIIKNK